MANTPDEAQEALARQQERAEKLAEEKSHLQLIIHMMEGLSTVPGLDNTVDNMLRLILNNIGGTDLILYYWVDSDLFRTDVFGNRAKLSAIEDDLVKKTFETRTSIEQDHDFSDTQMMTPEFTKARTLVYPLLVGSELIGILKLDGLYAAPHELHKVLPTFFNYAALILKSEILGHTQLKQANDRLTKSQALLDATGRMAKVGGWEIDLSSQRLTWTREVYRIHEVSEDFQPTVAAGIDFYAPESKPVIAAAVQRAIERGEMFDVQLKIITARKNRRWVHARGQARSQDGKIVTVAGTFQDITELKQAEAEKDDLERQLQEARKLESVGRLAGGVAHNFNNVLMGIMGYTELCQEQIAPDHPIREFLDEISGETKRLADLTRQLLGFARKQPITPKVLDLNDAASAILKFLRGQNGTEIDTVWNPNPALWPVKLDASQADQVLTALYRNACEAIDLPAPQDAATRQAGGAGTITVGTANVTLDHATCAGRVNAVPGDYVVLTVSDDGCGMDQEAVGKLFEPFFTTKDLSAGAGLGLATVYGIVKQNNGFINVDSEPGEGTTFSIYLPRFVPDATATTLTNRSGAPRGRGETILLVEDEKSLRVTCSLFLEALDYKVLVAEAPAEALEMVAGHPGDIHLMLTDVVMPEMDGRQLAQRISAVKPGIKVLFMSGYTANVIAQRGVLDEGVQFLSKPFTRDALAQKVREVLG